MARLVALKEVGRAIKDFLKVSLSLSSIQRIQRIVHCRFVYGTDSPPKRIDSEQQNPVAKKIQAHRAV